MRSGVRSLPKRTFRLTEQGSVSGVRVTNEEESKVPLRSLSSFGLGIDAMSISAAEKAAGARQTAQYLLNVRSIPLLPPAMFGSSPNEFASERDSPPDRFFSVRLPSRTVWGWERRDAAGEIVARSEQLFMDYITCFCDAQRRNDNP
jgi:hypothetical protein